MNSPSSTSFRLSRYRILPVLIACIALAMALAISGCNSGNSSSAKKSARTAQSIELDIVQSVVSSEELILELTPKLKWLSKDIMNLTLPDRRGKRLFAREVMINELIDSSSTTSLVSNLPSIVDRKWEIGQEDVKQSRESLLIWPSFVSEVDYFDHAKFYLIDGQFPSGNTSKFQSNLGFAGLARMKNGSLRSAAGKIKVKWEKEPNGPEENFNDWQIVNWHLKDFHAVESNRMLFDETTRQAIPDPVVRRDATRSIHHEFFIENYFKVINGEATTIAEPNDYSLFFPDVTFEHPGVSVVDIDRDGWDDLYVCAMRGRNFLFRNLGDGTFEEIAESVGLAVEGGSTSAVFADLDNDDDYDLILGRGRERAIYFVNDGGKFVDQTSSLIKTPMPYMVSSIAAADYNGDGLLDIYLGTYCPIEGGQGSTQSLNPIWVDAFMNEEQKVEIKKRLKQAHKILNMVGPPNVLLVNKGNGELELSPFNSQLESWKRCFQVAWSDYDQDGDPDVYLSNDYALDQLFRNDGEAGFVDVTKLLKVDKLGFGMGVSWADYNNDSHLDVYASNMFSKAGSRITKQIPGLDSRFQAMAYGNYLYEFDGNSFTLKSGYPDEPLSVSKAGWSWGGQFTDFNNDSFQDLYVASGYHTAPKEFSVDIDL